MRIDLPPAPLRDNLAVAKACTARHLTNEQSTTLVPLQNEPLGALPPPVPVDTKPGHSHLRLTPPPSNPKHQPSSLPIPTLPMPVCSIPIHPSALHDARTSSRQWPRSRPNAHGRIPQGVCFSMSLATMRDRRASNRTTTQGSRAGPIRLRAQPPMPAGVICIAPNAQRCPSVHPNPPQPKLHRRWTPNLPSSNLDECEVLRRWRLLRGPCVPLALRSVPLQPGKPPAPIPLESVPRPQHAPRHEPMQPQVQRNCSIPPELANRRGK